MNLRRAGNGPRSYPLSGERVQSGELQVLDEEAFQWTISRERKRTERSRKPFLLMLFDMGQNGSFPGISEALGKIVSTLLASTRETDVTGWYKDNSIIGVIFTELAADQKTSVVDAIYGRVTGLLKDRLTGEQFNQISISSHLFPDDWDHDLPTDAGNSNFYPDLIKRDDARKFFLGIKRYVDIVGSLLALMLSAPVFLAVALLVKMSSKGPIFFKQQRIGQHGKRFTFLKFRSMYIDSDADVHKEYVRRLIAGEAEQHPVDGGGGVYKLTNDDRVTRVGSLLRRTSLDELPQLINVLKGEMSLVGPRPPLQYEVEHYELWHRCRLIEAKPGITGLWQVNGRSRVKFDDMVRLDLLYARTWSLWLDLKIMFRTPRAVFQGAH